jgi:hypothetical protein
MDRAMIQDHLNQAERHIADGERHLSNQRALIAELEHDGHDTSAAKSLLRQFEELQALYVADRDRLRTELE